MTTPLVVVEVTRLLGVAFMAASWPFVVFDSLGKTVDVVGLKSKLDLREARLTAIVIGVMEVSLAPSMGTDLSSIGIELGFDPGFDEGFASAPQSLSDTAKDSLVVALRRCDYILADIFRIRHLPERVSRLNRRIYSSSLGVAIMASLATGCCWFLPDMHRGFAWAILTSLLLSVTVTVTFAVIRQRQVHDATQAIIDEDPQPRA